MMVTEHKKQVEYKDEKFSIKPIWWVIGGILLLIFLNLGGKSNSIYRSIYSKLNPITPTPTFSVEIIPAEGLDTDQANYEKLAVESLADKLKVKSQDIKVVSVKGKQWNDSSLGCPQRGMLYIQSVTPGYVIELSAREKTYIYNGGLNRVVSC